MQLVNLHGYAKAFSFRLLHITADVLLVEASVDSPIDYILELFFVCLLECRRSCTFAA